jgi:hypothetical protein
MSGSLVLIQETTVSSPIASVTLTGIDSTFNVYQVNYFNVQPSDDAVKLQIRFTVSGTPDTSTNYSKAQLVTSSTSAHVEQSSSNQSSIDSLDQGGTGTQETLQGVHYLFNFSNASEFSFVTYEGTAISSASQLNARQGGGVLKEAQANDGINYSFASGNIASGKFKLFGLVK